MNTAALTKEGVLGTLREMIAEIAETEVEKVTDDAQFIKDLGMDSVLSLEVLSSIENEFNIQIEEEEMVKMTTINNTYEIIQPQLGTEK